MVETSGAPITNNGRNSRANGAFAIAAAYGPPRQQAGHRQQNAEMQAIGRVGFVIGVPWRREDSPAPGGGWVVGADAEQAVRGQNEIVDAAVPGVATRPQLLGGVAERVGGGLFPSKGFVGPAEALVAESGIGT